MPGGDEASADAEACPPAALPTAADAHLPSRPLSPPDTDTALLEDEACGCRCIICLDTEGTVVQKGCLCRGDAGAVHVACLIEMASHASDVRGTYRPWWACGVCDTTYGGPVKLTLAETRMSRAEPLPEGHTERTRAKLALSNAYEAVGKYAEALLLDEEVYAVWRVQFGPDHHRTMTAQHNLGYSYTRMGRYTDAERVLSDLHARRVVKLGAHHKNTLITQRVLGRTFGALGQYRKSEEILRAVWEARKTAVGPDDPDTLISALDVSLSHLRLGKHEEAAALQRETIAIATRVYGAGHHTTLLMSEALSDTYNVQAKYTEALALNTRVIASLTDLIGGDHPNTAEATWTRAAILGRLGRYSEAHALQVPIVAKVQADLGPEHPASLGKLSVLAGTEIELGLLDEAERRLECALAALGETLGPKHPEYMLVQAAIGSLYTQQGKYAEAERVLRAAYAEHVRRDDAEGVVGGSLPTVIIASRLGLSTQRRMLPRVVQWCARCELTCGVLFFDQVLHLEPRERVAEAMARAGSSITVTSLTDLVAFLAGSYCSIPVVRAFCQYAAIGVTLDFVLQVTFFSVAMYMSGTREEQQKLDWLCCFLSSKPDAKLVGKGDFSRDQPEMLTVFLETIYAPRLISRGGKVVGVALGLSLLGLGIWACTRVTVDFEYEWFIPDDSYFQDTLAVRKRYYGAREVPVAMYTFSGNYSSSLSQSQYSKMTTALENNDMLVEDSCVNWWPDFIAFAESNASTAMTTFDGERIVGSAAFDQTFLNFYNDDAGSPYRNYLTVSNDVLELTEIPCRDDTARRDMTYRTEQMDRMREIAEICWSLGAVALGPAYWVQDAHKIFLREIVINLACALAGVFFITTLMLGSLVPSLIVTFLLVVIDVEVLGSIYLSGDYFNTVTGINLVLAVGLSVDAVAHITHAFLAHDGTGDERARRALVEIGRSVFNGAVSTMIVLLPLVGARTYVFQVFFRTFMAIIGYSAFNGLVVLPIILSVVVPSSYNTRRSRLGLEEHGRNNKSSVDSQKHPTIFNASPVFNASQIYQPPRAVSSF